MPTLSLKKKHFILITVCFLFFACKKKETPPEPPPPSSDKFILTFFLKQDDNSNYLINDVEGIINNDTISIVVPAETVLTALKPDITFTGKSISPDGETAQDFSHPVKYTVTAEDGSTREYVAITHYRSTVFISSADGKVQALDALTGELIWLTAIDKVTTSTPCINNGIIYYNAYDGLYAFDAKTGEQKWKYPITESYFGFGTFIPSPVVAGNIVYAPAYDGYIYALTAEEGTLKWKTRSDAGDAFSSGATIHNNLLYAGCEDSLLYAIDISNGNIVWKFNAHGQVYTNPLVVQDNICIRGYGKDCYLVNGANGNIIWENGDNGQGNQSSPTYDNGIIYVGGGNNATAFDAATGDIVLILYFNPDGLIYDERSSSLVSNGNFYAGSNYGKFYAYNATSGDRLWTFQALSEIFSSPVLCAGLLYFGDNVGSFYAIDAETGRKVWGSSYGTGVYSSACVVDELGEKHYPAVSGEKN